MAPEMIQDVILLRNKLRDKEQAKPDFQVVHVCSHCQGLSRPFQLQYSKVTQGSFHYHLSSHIRDALYRAILEEPLCNYTSLLLPCAKAAVSI